MITQKLAIIMTGLLSFLASCKMQDKKPQDFLTTGKFKVGQVWKYDNRKDEDSSTVTILKIEKYEKGDTIIHIRVDGVRIYSPNSPDHYTTSVDHMPFSIAAIGKSVTVLAGQNDHLPDFSEGYHHWRDAWNSNQGGYWTVNLKDAINGMDQVLRK